MPGAPSIDNLDVDGLRKRAERIRYVEDYGAVGDGNHDDTSAIQSAIDDLTLNGGGTLWFSSGIYKYSNLLTISNVTLGNICLRGVGRDFGGTVLRPTNCNAISIDGTQAAGGWKFRVKLADLMIWPNGTPLDANFITIIQAYNIVLENLWIYQTKPGARAVYVRGSNDVVLRDVIAYGAGDTDIGLLVDGAANVRSTVFTDCLDIENYSRGVTVTGAAILDMQSPYVERSIVSYEHQCEDLMQGRAVIHGGVLNSVNGTCIDIDGDNLMVSGTCLLPYQADKLWAWGITCLFSRKNIAFLNVPERWIDSVENPGTKVEATFGYPSNVQDGSIHRWP